jgi:hypothetical protein
LFWVPEIEPKACAFHNLILEHFHKCSKGGGGKKKEKEEGGEAYEI